MEFKRYNEDFKTLLVGFDFETIDNSPNAIYALSPELKLIYFNPSWFKFAQLNEGEPGISSSYPLGASIISAISGDIKNFYIENYKKVFQDLKVWKHEYECSTPKIYRWYYQEVFPLKNKLGIIVVNSLKVEKFIDDDFRKASTSPIIEYIDSDGIITQCSNCRKTRQATQVENWDWVPELITKMPENVSHSICPVCYDYYWKHNSINNSKRENIFN